MGLRHDEYLVNSRIETFRANIEKVAQGLEELAGDCRRSARDLPDNPELPELIRAAGEVVRHVIYGTGALHLDHILLNQLVDLVEADAAVDIVAAERQDEEERLAQPPVDHWDYLQRIAASRAHIPCRIRVGGRLHTGALTGMRVRDYTRASKSQYVNISEHNFDTLEVKVGNRYVPFTEAYPLDEYGAGGG